MRMCAVELVKLLAPFYQNKPPQRLFQEFGFCCGALEVLCCCAFGLQTRGSQVPFSLCRSGRRLCPRAAQLHRSPEVTEGLLVNCVVVRTQEE